MLHYVSTVKTVHGLLGLGCLPTPGSYLSLSAVCDGYAKL